jgi:hypothetical protein
VVDLLGYSTFKSERNGIALDNVQLNFLVDVSEGDVSLNGAHSAFEWIPLDDIDNRLIDSFTKRIMSSALEYTL